MKLHLPASLLSLLLVASCSLGAAFAEETSFTTDLGTVMYVGDSITHGVNSASYRWALHKILVDNGISYDAVGVKTGNDSGGVLAGTTYGGQAFNNVHSSQSSARAWEIAGRKDGTRFDHSNIQNWLGQSTTKNNGATYTGAAFTGENTPDTFFLLIGTNDTLSDYKNQLTPENVMDKTGTAILGDMDTIVSSMHTANSQAEIIVLSIPCWTKHASNNNNNDYNHEALQVYNEALTAWVSEYNDGLSDDKTKIKLVDVNKGMLDVASTIPFYGCSSMFNNPGSDGLHPNAQGDLIMAGNIAQALGYAGRTAGQQRREAEAFAVTIQNHSGDFTLSNVETDSGVINLGAEGTSNLSYAWAETADLTAGFTLDLGTVTLGDGSVGGWDTAQNLSVTFGAENFYGTLNINEAYIQWGDTVLYSMDMSQNTDSLRVSWLAGNNIENISGGYYVWLGDMLIGEALESTYETGKSGLSISYSGNGTATLTQVALTTGSYAPTTTGLLDADSSFVSVGPLLPATEGEPQGNISWVDSSTGVTASASNLTASGTYVARAAVDSTSGANGNVVSAEITSGSATYIFGNSGNYTGDVWLTISAEGGASSWYGAHGAYSGGGTLTGNAYLRFTDDAVGGSTVFGAVNATRVTGNVYVELSASGASFGSFTNNAGTQSSLVGAYQTNVGGNVDLVVNAGTLTYDVVGGIFAGNKTIGGTASVYVNGGSIGGKVMGGGYTGTINGGTKVTVTSGAIAGNVYGGGAGGTINAPVSKSRAAASLGTVTYASSVELTGGEIKGDVYGGGSAGTINGNTGVTVIGSAVRLHDGGTWRSIDGGSSGGTVTGNSIITLQDVISTNDGYGFDKYAGTITGGSNVAGSKTLVLDNFQVSNFAATLTGFTDVVLTNGTVTTLTSFGGASTVSIGDGCGLTLADSSGLTSLLMGEGASLSIQGLTAQSVLIDVTGVTNYSITLTNLTDDLSNITFVDGSSYYTAMLTGVDEQANTAHLVMGAAVPEPTTATLSLLALAGLAARRRRR